MKEALLYNKLKDNLVQCLVCDYKCVLKENEIGRCRVRKNIKGTLYSLNYGQTIAVNIDPIEKKPLYHFLPRTTIYSFASYGCNLHCLWCQNYTISQIENKDMLNYCSKVSPEDHIRAALRYKTPSIAYTYTEPTIFLEYALDTMKLAHQNNLKNVWVSNGFMSKETLELIIPYLDAINIDIKGPTDNFYQENCGGLLSSVLRNLKEIKKHSHIHLEITSLLIPSYNDSDDQIQTLINLIVDAVGQDVPWHVSRFFPAFQLLNVNPTPVDRLLLAQKLGKEAGMKYIYLGNI